jgi:hypothetical protein
MESDSGRFVIKADKKDAAAGMQGKKERTFRR